MKKLKIVNKTKFYKTMFTISTYIIYILFFMLLAEKGIISKIFDFIITVY